MTIIAMAEAILTIVSSGYACHGLCCGDKQVKSTQGYPLIIMVNMNYGRKASKALIYIDRMYNSIIGKKLID